MGEETRRRALAKLEAFTPKIGYPDTWRDYSALEIDPTDLLGNVRAANAFEEDRDLAKLGKPMDRDEWFMPPQTVNAYYNPTMNEIVFPAAILQPPFFDPDADDAVNYGGIGAVIGHEIGHGFDDQGSKYDGTGRLEDWWTEQDRARVRDAHERPSSPSTTPSPPPSWTGAPRQRRPDGRREHRRPRRPVDRPQGVRDRPAPPGPGGIDRPRWSTASPGCSASSSAWARIWRDEEPRRGDRAALTIDPHSPEEFRCNGVVRNMDAFYEAFDVRPGDALYLPPEERVRIW